MPRFLEPARSEPVEDRARQSLEAPFGRLRPNGEFAGAKRRKTPVVASGRRLRCRSRDARGHQYGVVENDDAVAVVGLIVACEWRPAQDAELRTFANEQGAQQRDRRQWKCIGL